MKKKFLSLLLIIMFIPAVFMFVGCKEKGYALSNLKKDYVKIADNCENVQIVDNKVVFDYAHYKMGSKAFVEETINNVAPYTELKKYNSLFDNLMGFVYEYIDVCSNNSIDASIEIRNELENNLSALNAALNEVDIYTSQWVEVLEFNFGEDKIHDQCLNKFKTLLNGYNLLLQRGINFSNSLANLYYDYALNDSNPRIDNIDLANFDSSVVIGKLPSRIKFQISNLSQIFVEMYVDGNNLPTYLTTKVKVEDETTFNPFVLDKTGFKYLEMVDSLKTALNDGWDAQSAVEVVNSNNSKKSEFYNLAIEAFNYQNVLHSDNNMFIQACNKISYGNVDASTEMNVRSKKIIDNYKTVIVEYDAVLNEILDCIAITNG